MSIINTVNRLFIQTKNKGPCILNAIKIVSCSHNRENNFARNPARCFHNSPTLCGLEEFFDKEENWAKTEILSGAAWTKSALRVKNTIDLQKIWYVLLKERNMLLTMEQYYIEQDYPMPGADRLEKVAESMSNLRDILDERDHARNMLLHGRKERVGGEWRINDLGFVYWYTYKEHLLPKEHNEEYKGDQPADIRYFENQKLVEWHLRMRERAMKNRTLQNEKLAKKWKIIRKRNPHLPVNPPNWWVKKLTKEFRYGMHPTQPILF